MDSEATFSCTDGFVEFGAGVVIPTADIYSDVSLIALLLSIVPDSNFDLSNELAHLFLKSKNKKENGNLLKTHENQRIRETEENEIHEVQRMKILIVSRMATRRCQRGHRMILLKNSKILSAHFKR